MADAQTDAQALQVLDTLFHQLVQTVLDARTAWADHHLTSQERFTLILDGSQLGATVLQTIMAQPPAVLAALSEVATTTRLTREG